jgi:DMSO/TMAO reductase YedYZ molybdopterin-dependent catalytic subunit
VPRDRLPPGQRLVRGWPVLHEGSEPVFHPDAWRLRIWGEVEAPLSLDWADFQALPVQEVIRDLHCVTTWSRYDNRWAGVRVQELLQLAAGPGRELWRGTRDRAKDALSGPYPGRATVAGTCGKVGVVIAPRRSCALSPPRDGPSDA